MTVIEVLKSAQSKVAAGWCQGKASDGDGNICAVHAIALSCPRRYEDTTLFDGACGAIVRVVSPVYGLVNTWNDAPGRTQQQVLDVFDKAIQLEAHATA